MKKELPTFSFHTVTNAFPEDEDEHWNNIHGLTEFSKTASDEDLRSVLKSIKKEAGTAHQYEEESEWSESYWDIYNLNFSLVEIIDNRPEMAGNVLDIIDAYYKLSKSIDDHSRWTIESIGCLGDKELAKRATRLLGRFDYEDDSEHREVFDIPTVKSPIDNILNAYNDDPLFQQTLKKEYTQGLKDKLEISRNKELREKRRIHNKTTDPLAYKMKILENYNLHMQPLRYNWNKQPYHETIGDIGKTGDSKTGEVLYDQKERAKRLKDIAKETMKNSKICHR